MKIELKYPKTFTNGTTSVLLFAPLKPCHQNCLISMKISAVPETLFILL